mgnify:CR=1 FL=1|jgi:hypothetical protein
MTIESALQGIYPNQIVSESVSLGSKLYLTMNHNDLARNWISYWVARENTTEIIFKFNPSGVVYVYKDVTLTPHEKRVITKIISMWREHMRPDWETFESMRANPMISFADATRVPVMHNTL